MYIATQAFHASSGRFFLKGDKISKLWYFFLPKRDKIMFEKEADFISKTNISKDKTVKPYLQSSEAEREERRRELGIYSRPRQTSSLPSNQHYGYGPEPGYSNSHITHYPFPTHQVDDTPSHSNHSHDSHHHSHSDSGYSHHDSGNYDSGYSSSDSSSCDSGGGDCGGGCDGGGGGCD